MSKYVLRTLQAVQTEKLTKVWLETGQTNVFECKGHRQCAFTHLTFSSSERTLYLLSFGFLLSSKPSGNSNTPQYQRYRWPPHWSGLSIVNPKLIIYASHHRFNYVVGDVVRDILNSG